jgi:hypothetical protein
VVTNGRAKPYYCLDDAHARSPPLSLPRRCAGPRRRPAASTAEALKSCEDGELFLQYTASEAFAFDDGRLKTADFNSQAGFGLRGVSGETTAFAHANVLAKRRSAARPKTMSVLDPVQGARAAPPRRTNATLYTDSDPLSAIPFRAQGGVVPGSRRRRPAPAILASRR